MKEETHDEGDKHSTITYHVKKIYGYNILQVK
jgi:hypothetical protein